QKVLRFPLFLLSMKFFLNSIPLRNRRQNPNPIPPSPAMLSDLASDSGDGRQEEAASSSSSAVMNSDDEEEDMGYESPENEVSTTSFSGTEIEDEQEGNREPTAEDEDRRELDGASSKSLVVVEAENAFLRTEKPPTDDCCPICFGNFVVPCQGPCGHWYCGGCILQYWNYGAALQPCNCPMCSRKLTDLTPEASLYSQQDAEVIEVLKKVRKYNRLFIGGTYGLMLKVLGLPFYMKRVFNEMMNPDRPGAHLNKLRIFAAVKMSLMCLIILPLHYPQCYIWLGCIFDEGVSTMLGKWLRLILLVIDSCRLVKQIFVVNSLWSLKILDL
ncbi:hypothetical protein AABB24_002084, partial [Solanum stoloniferum]